MVDVYNLYDISWNYSTFIEDDIHAGNSYKKYGNVKEERLNMGFIYGPQYIKPLTYLKYENNVGPQHQDHEGNFNGVLCLHFQDLNFCCFKGLFIYLLDLHNYSDLSLWPVRQKHLKLVMVITHPDLIGNKWKPVLVFLFQPPTKWELRPCFQAGNHRSSDHTWGTGRMPGRNPLPVKHAVPVHQSGASLESASVRQQHSLSSTCYP